MKLYLLVFWILAISNFSKNSLTIINYFFQSSIITFLPDFLTVTFCFSLQPNWPIISIGIVTAKLP
jgi:hypothetical protein